MVKNLIIKLGALGDIVMATSLIKQIQQHHENDESFLLTTPGFANIFESWNKLNVVSFERKGPASFIKVLRWIRNKHFDRIYDLQSNDRTSIFCALSGASTIIGNHPRYPYNIHPVDKYTGQCHIYDRMLDVLLSAGLKPVHEIPCLPVSAKDRDYVKTWLRENHLSQKPLVILHAGASNKHSEKCWPYFEELAVVLGNRGFTIIWAGGESEKEINKQLALRVGLDASNLFSINQLAELGRYARFALTNDSGPMHALASSEIPVFSFFGPTNWRRNHAIGQADNVITLNRNDPFRPVSLDKITVDMAISCLESQGLI